MSDMASAARQIMRRARRAALATIDAATGGPFASLVAVATLPRGEPVILISKLARHTQNIDHDARASLLFDGGGSGPDILADGRVTVTGSLMETDAPEARQRYLRRHGEAAGYAGFTDFSFFRLDPVDAHLVQGFGRIRTFSAEELLLPQQDCQAIGSLEAGALDHLNADHADAVNLYAARLCGAAGGHWRAIGLDPEGLDMCSEDGAACRLTFPAPVHNAADMRATLARLAQQARADGQ